MSDFENNQPREEIFSKSVRAGKRTYFFDVKATRANEYYLTITESKKRFEQGSEKAFYEKHKVFLYKEDFEKFMEGLNEALEHIKTNQPEIPKREGDSFTDVSFNDLGS